MRIVLPVCLGRVADQCGESCKWASGGVHVVIDADGSWHVFGTDEKQFLYATGPRIDGDELPFPTAPDTGDPTSTATIPADHWKATFQEAEKLTKYAPKLQYVVIDTSPNSATISYGNIDVLKQSTFRTLEGLFPAKTIRGIVSKVRDWPDKRIKSRSFDPERLVPLLTTMRRMAEPCQAGSVFLQTILDGGGGTGIYFTAPLLNNVGVMHGYLVGAVGFHSEESTN